MPERPAWLGQYKRPGTVFKFNGRDWFLYSNKSVRVPGKKNPQPVQKCLGRVTERGLVATVDVYVDQREIRTWEYGFTHAVLSLFPESAHLKEWDEPTNRLIMIKMIGERSPESFLLEESPSALEMRDDLAQAMAHLFVETTGITFEQLEPLRTVRLIDLGTVKVVGHISPQQRALFASINVEVP